MSKEKEPVEMGSMGDLLDDNLDERDDETAPEEKEEPKYVYKKTPKLVKLGVNIVILAVYIVLLVLAITQGKRQCSSGLELLCSDLPASHWYCAVEVDGVPTVVKDGWTNGNLTCTVDDQGCCRDDVLITDNRVVLGVLFGILSFIFNTANSGYWILDKFYLVVPALFLCYFMPGILGSFGVYIGHDNQLGSVASAYFLPATLGLLCLNVDLKGIAKLGIKAIIMFLVGTLGVVLGGPFAVWIMSMIAPSVVCGDQVWRGLSYISGSWIGGGANAVAMVGIFEPSADAQSQAVAVDVFVANIWLAILFILIANEKRVNKVLRADNSAVEEMKDRMARLEKERGRIPTGLDLINIAAIGWICCGISNYLASVLSKAFGSLNNDIVNYMALNSAVLWRVLIATVFGLGFSFTSMKNVEGAGASKVATVYLYFLVLTIGMGMDITAIARNPGIFGVGFIWILFHGILLFAAGFALKAPLFFICVASQANIGGAASAPVVAAQFHPSLAPVGALFAVFGYIVGTFGGWACSMMMRAAAVPCPE